ncbi:MAG TPA: c-type cytochrome [Longimicrobiales bacterium]
MLATNLKIVAVVLGTVLFYTVLANSIPQVESEVPSELTFGADVTPEKLVAAGEELYNGAGGCTACHGLGTRAPNLLTDEAGTGPIGVRCANRVPGQDCKQYLHTSMVDPAAHVVPGYEPIMPDMRRTLSGTQIWAIVAYLQSQGGEVTVTAEDIAAVEAEGATTGTAAGGQAGSAASAGASLDPLTIMRENQCLVCHKLGDEGGPLGPELTRIGARLDADAIRRSILDPAAEAAEGFDAMVGVMPATFGQQLTAAQLEALVQYLAAQR